MMKIIKKLQKSIFSTQPTNFYVFQNEFLDKKELVDWESSIIQENGCYYEYVFKNPVTLDFKLKKSKEQTQLLFENVHKFVLVELMNVFLECRVVSLDNGEIEKFYILNDVSDVEFLIKK